MKKNVLLIVCLLIGMACSANVKNGKSELSDKYIMTSLSQVGNSTDGEAMLKCVNDMKRISKFDADNWLAPYYQCLFGIRYSLENTGDAALTAMEDARCALSVLKTMEDADASEVATLDATYKFIVMMNDKTKYDKSGYREIMNIFDHASSCNPANPRPRIMKFFVQQKIGRNFGYTTVNRDQDIKEITELIKTDKAQYPQPAWGEETWNKLFAR